MRLGTILLAALASLAATATHAAGLKFIQVPADAAGPSVDAAMWSPCATAPGEVKVKGTTVPAVPDCPIVGAKLPLVVISHGYGGWYLDLHDMAETLADAGFIVVAINHPHANHADMSQANGLGVLRQRPLDIKRTIDFMLGASPDSASIDPQRVGFYGFSQGGYTGLVVGGANPDFNKLPPRCPDPTATGCPPANQPKPVRKQLPPEVLTHDPRVKAIVVADPLSIVFQTSDSLKDVKVPLQLWSSQFGGDGISSADVKLLAGLLPRTADFHVVPNAVHFSFLASCRKTGMPSDLCVDRPGFDRSAFHKMFDTDVLAFFRQHLVDGPGQTHVATAP
ncbi:dienelactone hydrolase [Mesorhizobium sp. B2-3-4]|uniref:alpha/beta hydrolase family protein n=1 Tax=Mesorhizobium sp. B2-3-4 TaxID=2589959 RepID=UPI00112AE10D|nr:dienelactone hydrolase [Mesorhizobium sp. B2-3-4]TPM38666.1 dienelactone hydrolase [Mesorhizobium sp. B2-3-4]